MPISYSDIHTNSDRDSENSNRIDEGTDITISNPLAETQGLLVTVRGQEYEALGSIPDSCLQPAANSDPSALVLGSYDSLADHQLSSENRPTQSNENVNFSPRLRDFEDSYPFDLSTHAVFSQPFDLSAGAIFASVQSPENLSVCIAGQDRSPPATDTMYSLRTNAIFPDTTTSFGTEAAESLRAGTINIRQSHNEYMATNAV
ncbi:uncharacterized protein Z518_11064 [Rhinocladiella mackenziei CBS 650.93]|uniref:Uncharacterized protein n=1 Tax=Rhinocladiella mackenziei CBS 650.93 TaxID=1442369 RepID=A0A0D2FC09_9EURO|nr:uncharacterized protein Z518_11064 [Rhinocladiella mackenziei CBS 650.93]KIW99651.1 hypothetical protein Z518_11064 [Rhinocladiella mackenziei CBS 650.93]